MSEAIVIDLGNPEDRAPVRTLVYMVLLLAVKDRATEVSFERQAGSFKIRECVDGIFYELVPPPRQLEGPILNVLKIMAELDSIRKKRVQRGFVQAQIGEAMVDLLVSVQPIKFGERVIVDIFASDTAPAEATRALTSSLARQGEFCTS